ncbi:MAG: hypothetical protein C4318_01815 [Acidimicrobiia bacterium]
MKGAGEDDTEAKVRRNPESRFDVGGVARGLDIMVGKSSRKSLTGELGVNGARRRGAKEPRTRRAELLRTRRANEPRTPGAEQPKSRVAV